jgi:hypothetical protein
LLENFEKNLPEDSTKIGDYYDSIDPDLYDEFIIAINFTVEPDTIISELQKILPEPSRDD